MCHHILNNALSLSLSLSLSLVCSVLIVNVDNPTEISPSQRLVLPTGKSEDTLAAEVVDSAIQHVVGDGGQRVITIVTDQHGNLQPAGLSQQFFVTMQGQQS